MATKDTAPERALAAPVIIWPPSQLDAGGLPGIECVESTGYAGATMEWFVNGKLAGTSPVSSRGIILWNLNLVQQALDELAAMPAEGAQQLEEQVLQASDRTARQVTPLPGRGGGKANATGHLGAGPEEGVTTADQLDISLTVPAPTLRHLLLDPAFGPVLQAAIGGAIGGVANARALRAGDLALHALELALKKLVTLVAHPQGRIPVISGSLFGRPPAYFSR